MNLRDILQGITDLKANTKNIDIEINNICQDSRNVQKGDIFIAIKGYDVDGHKFINNAIEKGAIAIVINENEKNEVVSNLIKKDIIILAVKDTREAISKMACNYYGNPSREVKLIGITGTKGKTTITYMIKKILEENGIKTGLFGTIAEYSGNKEIMESIHTTPESLDLQRMMRYMVDDGCKVIVMEVSSQSLKLHRVDGCDFDICGFTNFSEDHISPKEHPNMEDYFNSKLLLFKKCKKAFLNADDPNVIKTKDLIKTCEFKTFGIDNSADLLAKDIQITNSYVDYVVKINGKNERIKVGIPGRFSVYNSLISIGICMELGLNIENMKDALEKIRVPGRSEMVDNELGLKIMIDYAHTPDSLKNILQAAKTYTKGKVICVFGCAGERDSRKRPMMGEVAGKIADYTIISSVNIPRTEDPAEITREIEVRNEKNKWKI